MKLFPNAKINLGLFVTEKRKDGFHNLESLFLPVPWYDELEVVLAEKFHFSSLGIEIDGNSSNNLCVKAYDLLKNDFDLAPVSINLIKNIPIGAGLGGGSSDAAFTLKGVNAFFNLGLSESQLMNYAAKLGSDCAFFIPNLPSIASGKGEIISPVNDFRLNHYCLIVYPNLHIETKKAYENIQPQKAKFSISELLKNDVATWKNNLINDFEAPLLEIYPQLKSLKNQLFEMGAAYVSMSGSGSSFFAFFDKLPKSYLFPKDYPYRIFKLAF